MKNTMGLREISQGGVIAALLEAWADGMKYGVKHRKVVNAFPKQDASVKARKAKGKGGRDSNE